MEHIVVDRSFQAINQASRFEFESGDHYHYQTIAGPKTTIIAKLIYNSSTCSCFAAVFFVCSTEIVFIIQAYLPWDQHLAALGLEAILTLANGIAERSGGNATLSSILAFFNNCISNC